MDYLATARKWRPTHFEDLVGQVHVVQTLQNAITLNRVTHAYLFCGARGIGKTTVARIFAKALRCPNAKEASPCNQCPECHAIGEGRAVDVIEIDGASNNGVEAIREIRENVAYGAASGKYKIYIIDEVHMLSVSAFNALLKTLEEPPAHVLFFFATTESQKIPLTILSRCQRFEFRRLTNQQIVGRLQKILESEPIQISEEGLRIIASHSDGALRDALSLLDQVLSFHGNSTEPSKVLNETEVIQALGVSDINTIHQLLGAIFSKQPSQIVEIIGNTYLSGVDLKGFAERTLEELRLIYLLVLGKEANQPPSAESLDISSQRLETLQSFAKTLSLTQTERMSQILSTAINQIGWSSLPRFVLEMAAVRMSKLEDLLEIENSLKSLSLNKHATPPTNRPSPTETQATATPPTAPSAPVAPYRRTDSPHRSWQDVVDHVMKKRPLLGALLSHANFKLDEKEGKKSVLLAFPEDSFYEKQAKEKKNRSDIENQLKEFFGSETEISISNEMKETHDSLEKVKDEEVASIKKAALENPTVQQAKATLGAEIVDITVEPGR